ncbi:acylneuraminate cytidylyltransferase [Tautonia sociabilis]|uniref:N-acylneuraminate cytidylyltransferase n=1 Tax=Tautonia sociabilis TaxID=2080755 RepID=A0A432MJ32_9BACT|nr:acylneuraminate cytidylyltransferase [Tautonia sociabilis]RUL87166.1 acylneuraminate cytidylyltransferase [Tautonia sociabilis]
MSDIIAVIPARGGSKGLPRKNVLPVAGKPLLGWTVEAARASRLVGRVVVSTDDPEIAAVALRFGAEVVDRPAELSGDSASSESALLHTLDVLRGREGYEPDLLAFLQCTSPLTAPEDIDGTIEALERQSADTALAVVPFHYFLWRPDGTGINHDKARRPLRQEREPQFLEAGAVYAMKVPGFRAAKHRFFGKTALYEMPAERRWEIDDPADLEIAGALLRRREAADRQARLPDRLGALVFDFDGVFTDNRVTVLDEGREAVVCDRSDGLGLERLRRAGWPMLVLSKESHPIVSSRCAKLKLECIQGIDEKLPVLLRWLESRGVSPEEALYLGNDVNDLPCLGAVGCPVAVADAYPEAIEASRIVLSRPGGRGALRELADLILNRYGTPHHA